MADINNAWHEQHRMPDNPTPMEQIAWHEAHQKHCACRPIPASVKKLIPPNGSKDQS